MSWLVAYCRGNTTWDESIQFREAAASCSAQQSKGIPKELQEVLMATRMPVAPECKLSDNLAPVIERTARK